MKSSLSFLLLSIACAGLSSASEKLVRFPRPDFPGEAWAVRVGDVPLAYTGQILPWGPGGGFPAGAGSQATQAIANLRAVLTRAGIDFGQIIRINVYVTTDDVSSAVDAALGAVFADQPPVVTFVRSPLGPAEALLALDAIAQASGPGPIVTWIPPFNRPGGAAGVAVAVLPPGEKVFLSGEVARDPEIRPSIAGAMASLERDLGDLGLAKSAVVQVKAVIQPYAGRGALEQVVADFFAGMTPPPLVVVEGGAPNSAEIEMTAGGMGRTEPISKPVSYRMYSGHVPNARFSDIAIVAPAVPLIFTAGLDGDSPDPRGQAEEAFLRLSRILFETGGSYGSLVKSTAYYTNTPTMRAMSEIRGVFYHPAALPASTATVVSGIGRAGRTYTVDMIAAPVAK